MPHCHINSALCQYAYMSQISIVVTVAVFFLRLPLGLDRTFVICFCFRKNIVPSLFDFFNGSLIQRFHCIKQSPLLSVECWLRVLHVIHRKRVTSQASIIVSLVKYCRANSLGSLSFSLCFPLVHVFCAFAHLPVLLSLLRCWFPLFLLSFRRLLLKLVNALLTELAWLTEHLGYGIVSVWIRVIKQLSFFFEQHLGLWFPSDHLSSTIRR